MAAWAESMGVGVAPPLGFQLATLQISSIPSSFGLPSLLVRPYSFACFRSQISSAFFGVLPFNAAQKSKNYDEVASL
jgi:hypothetical protein